MTEFNINLYASFLKQRLKTNKSEYFIEVAVNQFNRIDRVIQISQPNLRANLIDKLFRFRVEGVKVIKQNFFCAMIRKRRVFFFLCLLTF